MAWLFDTAYRYRLASSPPGLGVGSGDPSARDVAHFELESPGACREDIWAPAVVQDDLLGGRAPWQEPSGRRSGSGFTPGCRDSTSASSPDVETIQNQCFMAPLVKASVDHESQISFVTLLPFGSELLTAHHFLIFPSLTIFVFALSHRFALFRVSLQGGSGMSLRTRCAKKSTCLIAHCCCAARSQYRPRARI